jgi:hypothetical protein
VRLVDDVVLDPVEAGENRVELNLSELGLTTYNADFGDNSIEATAIRTGLGQTLVDRRPKPRNIVFDLGVREDADEGVDLAAAAYRLEQKLGTMQEKGGWLRRDFYFDEFAGSLLYKITGEVGLSNILGWRTGDDTGMPTLSFVCDLVGYSTEEREQGPFTSAAGSRHLIFTEESSPGTAKGLWRGRITNKSDEDLRGLILSRECDSAPEDLADPTAQPHYLAKNLTPKGGAEVKTVSGVELIQHNALTAGWLTILSSEITGVGHMTHKGPRRMWFRVYDPGEVAGGVELRLMWRALGGSRWEERMPTIAVPVVDRWMPVTLGITRPEEAVIGDQRWEWKLVARAPSGSGVIRVRDVYPLSTEQYLELSEPYVPPTADASSQKTPGAAESVEDVSRPAWTGLSNIGVSDNARAVCNLGKFFPQEQSEILKLTNFAFGLPEKATVAGIIVGIERSRITAKFAYDRRISIVRGGVIGSANRAVPGEANWPSADELQNYGSATDLWEETWTAAAINSSSFGVAIQAQGSSGNPGEIGVDNVVVTVYYAEPGGEDDKVCFDSRSLELRSDAAIRQHQTEDVWGMLVADGFPPYLSPGGLENRPVRTILIPSVGDLRNLPDSPSSPPLVARSFGRDGYHFAREAVAS